MKVVLLVALLVLAGCTTHQTYDATLTYEVVAWPPDDDSRYRATNYLLHRVPGDEPAPIKAADVEYLPHDQAPAGIAVGVKLKCRVHQERDSVNVAAADANETFGPCERE